MSNVSQFFEAAIKFNASDLFLSSGNKVVRNIC